MRRLSLFVALITTVFIINSCNEHDPLSSEISDSNGPINLAKKSVDTELLNPGSYILYSNSWSSTQSAAVVKAGGKVTFSDMESGIGIVYSEDANFTSKAKKSGAFTGIIADAILNWQEPGQTVEIIEEGAPDPSIEGLWGYQWNMIALEAPAAWEAGYTGKDVRVAVLDGGISSDHIDIAANLDVAASASFVPGKNYDEDEPGFRHATHVAGIIAAPANSIGTLGVAPEATIIGVKVLDNGSGAFSWILQGILYASTPMNAGGGGADIINMSLGGIIQKNGRDAAQTLAIFNRVMNTAAQRGVLVISAAGNEGLNFDHLANYIILPAEAGHGVVVSATGPVGFYFGATNFRDFAAYSNYGNSLVKVAGPGGADESYPNVGWYFDMVLSPSYVEGTSQYYSFADGTSMATPAVAGVAALIKQKNPGISVAQLKAKLAQTADDEGKPGHDAYYGNGFVNARRAVMD